MLIFIALALALSPLRGAFALPVMAAVDDTSHCGQMQTVMPLPDNMIGIEDSAAADSDNDCKHGCDGVCCDDACNSCVHVTSAISNIISLSLTTTSSPHQITPPVSFSVRTVIPLLRPPASL